jgi:hypothetical protein
MQVYRDAVLCIHANALANDCSIPYLLVTCGKALQVGEKIRKDGTP